jgi:2-dehydropantoate 2-reductase
MKVLIVGAGVIGSIYGWALSKAGHTITHLVRLGRSDQFRNGIAIDMMDRRKGHKKWLNDIYHITVTEIIPSKNDFDIVIIPVRHYALEDTLKQLVPVIPKTGYILLTQNWKGTSEIDLILPHDKYIFGDAKAGGSFHENKLIGTIYAIDIGSIDNVETEILKRAQTLFISADLKTTIQNNILHYLWIQYAINGGGWPAVVQAGGLKSVLKSPKLVQSLMLSVRECIEILKARGVEIDKYHEIELYITDSSLKKIFYMLMMKLLINHSKYIQRNSAHALADPKEIKTFYYNLIGTGTSLGISTPVMHSFKDIIDKLGTITA